MRIIGIDPGASGGMACFIEDALAPDTVALGKLTERDIAAQLEDWSMRECFAYIEKVGANRGPAGRRQGASSMFTFGQNFGFLRGCLVALHIPFEEVMPQKWQAMFSLKRVDSAESTTDKKNRHKAKAQNLFPSIKLTHAVADAMLLAEYGRRLRSNQGVFSNGEA